MVEPGLDLHDWTTRWEQLEEAAHDSPDEAATEMGRLIEEMLRDRGFQLDEPVTLEGDEPGIVKQYLAAREIGLLIDGGEADPGDVAAAIEGYREIYQYVIEDRAPP